MNLHSYFTQQGEQKLSDERKFLLYQRICEQRSIAPQSLKRSTLLTKNRIYAFLAFALFFVFFGNFFWENTEISEYRAFFTQKVLPGFGAVNAAQVGEILEFNGEYIIEKEGKQFKNSVIFDGDIITLKNNAKIIFNINEHIKAEVQGPAKFTITKLSEENYRLSLIEGNYLKLDGEKDSDALEIETHEIVISSAKNEVLALEFSQNNKNPQLKNAGAPLLVKNKKAKAKEDSITLETAKLLTIQDNDITEIRDLEHFEKVLVNRKNLTHTTKINSEAPEKNLSLEHITKELEILSGTKDFERNKEEDQVLSGVQKTVDTNLAYQSDEKKIPTEAQLSQITAALNKTFLLTDIQNLYTAKLENNTEAIQSAYRIIAWRIKSIGDSYSIEIKVDTNPETLIAEIQKLQKGLEAYHLPPSKNQQIEVIKNWLIHLKSFTPDQPREEYKQHLSKNLQFK